MCEVESYFEKLPIELVFKILGKVEISPLIYFCQAYPQYDSKLLRTLNLGRNFELNNFQILPSIKEHVNLELITTFNVNGLFWLSGANLRKFVRKLVNLEILCAVDTELGLMEVDINSYLRTKIKKLAVTGDFYEDSKNKMLSVETLYLKVTGHHFNLLYQDGFVLLFANLKKLWVDYTDAVNIENRFVKIFLNETSNLNLKKFTYTSYGNSREHTTNLTNHINYFRSGKGSKLNCICFENFNSLNSLLDCNKLAYNNFAKNKYPWKDLGNYCPYGPIDARKLVISNISLENIQFEELSFYLKSEFCTDTFQHTAKTILKSFQAKNLKRLSIRNCLLSDQSPSVNLMSSSQQQVSFDLLSTISNLKEIEVYPCENNCHKTAPGGYFQISNLKYLTHLTLIIPDSVDCKFLIDVTRNCKYLTSLRITSSQNDNLNNNLSAAIQYASSLKDFRFEHDHILFVDLMKSFCQIQTSSLQRIYLMCETVEKLTVELLEKFLTNFGNLIFFYLVIKDFLYSDIKEVCDKLEDYNKHFVWKRFSISNMACIRYYDIANINLDEMVLMHSRVCVMDYYRDFKTF